MRHYGSNDTLKGIVEGEGTGGYGDNFRHRGQPDDGDRYDHDETVGIFSWDGEDVLQQPTSGSIICHCGGELTTNGCDGE